MLKTLNTELAKPRKSGIGIGSSRKVRRDRSEIDGDKVNGSEFEDNEIEKKVQKTSKSKNLSKSKKTIGSSDFFIPGAKLVFTKLRQVFFKALILYHFNLERHIRIEINISGYAFSGVLSQQILDNWGQWHPMVFFSSKMILAETRYKTHNGELLAIIETFKI